MKRRFKAIGLVVALAAVLTGTPVAGISIAAATEAHLASPQSAAPTVLPPGQTYTVTLLTGDVVTVRTQRSGCPLVSVKPARPSAVITKSCRPDGHVRVVPNTVAAQVGTTLDPSLFDVTTLVQQGYDDAHSPDLPLIVQYAADAARLAHNAFGSGLAGQRSLPSIHGLAGRQPKAQSATQTQALLGLSTTSGAHGVRHIWLDQKLHASQDTKAASTTLDRDLTQIGAPRAWSAGYTGRGVRVAVLDTGVDATHPDLVGRIAESANFSDSADTVDRFGHGTHVAATIAGTGTVSAGQRRGVAPDAQLIIGKVLGDDGSGSDSQVIAGMQWAAPRAPVINMSLGGLFPSDGSDPLSQALDALTAQYGALFVVAAGNSGPDDSTISSPAASASALTVGAVNATDTVADFSSRGPLIHSYAAKPEIVAPGVDIVAARAAGTSLGTPIDAYYSKLSGTSMATPHVAGAAAIIAQRHPDWHANQIKAALVGGADPADGADIYGQGSGRLDIPRALGGLVADQAIVNLGTFTYPQSGVSESTLGWTNTSNIPLTLQLSVDLADRAGHSVPAGTAALSVAALTLMAGQSRSATLRVNQAQLAARPGLYEGVVTARSHDVAVRVPVALHVEPPSYNLTVRATALPNTPLGALAGWVDVVDIENPASYENTVALDATGRATMQVPAGRYSVIGEVQDTTVGASRDALSGYHDVSLTRSTTLTLDGASAKPVTATVSGVVTKTIQAGLAYVQAGKRGSSWWYGINAWGADADRDAIYAAPVRGSGAGFFHPYELFTLIAPGNGPSPFLYDLMRALPTGAATGPKYLVDGAEQARLARIDQRFDHLDLSGSTTAHKRYGLTPDFALISEEQTDDAPATRVDYVTPGISWFDEAFYSGVLSHASLTAEQARSYLAGSRQAKAWVRQPLRPDWFDDQASSASFCTPEPISRTSGNLHVALIGMTDQHQRFGCLDGDPTWEKAVVRTLTLTRNGQQIGSATGSSRADFTVPSSAATYRITYDLDTSALLPVSTRVTTSWTFSSTGPSDHSSVAVPLLSLDYALPLDAFNHPSGGTSSFTIHQATGAAGQHVIVLSAWTSIDDGNTWTSVPASRSGSDRFTAQLPAAAAGQFVSVKVSVTADGGSAIDQTIIRAYRMPTSR